MTTSRGMLYCRLSRAQADDKVMSLAEQEKKLRAQAKRLKIDVLQVFVDDGISAYDENATRPGFIGLCTAVEGGEVDYIMAVRMDRFSRLNSVTDTLLYLCAQKSVKIIADGQEIDPGASPMAKAMAQIGGVMGELESAIKSQRLRDARQAAAEQGRGHPGPRPFGYDHDRKTLHKIEGAAYRELFDRVIEGESLYSITQDWAARGILNRNGRPFSSFAMKQLLQQPRAIGLRVHRGEVIGEGDWEPIVTREIQQHALAVRRSRRPLRSARSPVRKARLLSSLTFCDACGAAMRVRYNEHPTQKAQYLCNPALRDACGSVCVNADLLEAEVEKRFLFLLQQPKTQKALDRLRNREPQTLKLVRELERVREEIDAYTQDAAARRITHKQFTAIVGGLQTEADEIEARLALATDAPAMLSMAPDEIVENWGRLDLEKRRKIVASWIERVRVAHRGTDASKVFNPQRVLVDWRV